MTLVIGLLLAVGIGAAWHGAASLVRLATPLERLHVVPFVNVATGGALTLAALLADGLSSRTLKIVLIWIVALVAGSLLSHAAGRAIHVRDGGRR